jgi:DNA-directed RNA polymerase I, II, and III subunit RPABC2
MIQNDDEDPIIDGDEDDVNDSDDDVESVVVDESDDEDDEQIDDTAAILDDEDDEDDGDDGDDGDDRVYGENVNKLMVKNDGGVEADDNITDSDGDDDDDDDENYLQKINAEMSSDIIANNHHELKCHNAEEIEVMCKVVRNTNGTIIDPLHTTLPFLTRYEIANILGNRATQIESGATPFVEVKDNIIDPYLIAMSEFKQKKIPYIIRRPLPNGGSEYWKFSDLEQLD